MPLCALLQEDLHFPLMLRQGLLTGWDTPASIQVPSPKVLTSGFSCPLSGVVGGWGAGGGWGVPRTSGQISVVTFAFVTRTQLNAFSVFAVNQSLPRFLACGRPRGMGQGTYLILLIEKRMPGGRKGVCVVLHLGFHTVAGDPSEPMFLLEMLVT